MAKLPLYLTINEFVPSLKLLQEYMETPEPPPLPTNDDISTLNALRLQLKELFIQYKELMDDDMNAKPETPEQLLVFYKIKQTQIEVLNAEHYINDLVNKHKFHKSIWILKRHNLGQLLNSFLYPLNSGIPAITYFLLKYDDITKGITNPDDYIAFRKFDLIPMIVEKKVVKLKIPISIPMYNLIHIGNICHFNSCINILSSMTLLINELAMLRNENMLTSTAGNIYQYLLNAHSFIDLNPSLLLKILPALNISLMDMEEANETMKKIMRCLYQSGVHLSTVFYWDSTDEFYKHDEMQHTLSTKLSELKPKYFLCNIHDFNAVYDIDQNTIQLEAFDVEHEDGTIDCSYTLTSFIIFQHAHYFSAFIKDINEREQEKIKVEIRNDLMDRYAHQETLLLNMFTRGFQHVMGLYVRQDLFRNMNCGEEVIQPINTNKEQTNNTDETNNTDVM